MKFIIILLFPLCIYSQSIEFSKLLERSTNSIASCDSLMQFCISEDDPQKIAYMGAGLMLKSKHHRKLKYFKKGRNKLDDIISKYPNFVELRWIRYCIQKSTPKILNYKQHIETDALIIQKYGNHYQKNTLKGLE